MVTPKVSVLMSAYNAERYIGAAIESILSQTFKDFEFIIVNDASTDRTLSVIKKYSKKDKRITVLNNPKNLYIASNRNKCIENARGEYIVWQDADDISYDYRVEEQVKFMDNNPKVGICGGYLDSFSEGVILDKRIYSLDDKSLRKNIFRQSPVAQPSAIIRKECFDKVGLYNPKYPPAEDIDMSFRIGTYYKFANLPMSIIKYREHPNSQTFKRLRKILKNTLEIRKKNISNRAYKFTIVDVFYQFATIVAMLVPPYIVVWVFKKLRGR